MGNAILQREVSEFRSFNRFYTRQIGLLNRGLLETPFSLTQARILFELAQTKETSARDLTKALSLDRGYLSRIMSSFERQGLIRGKRSNVDSRRRLLALTSKGKKTFSLLDSRSNEEAKMLLSKLTPQKRVSLLRSLKEIERILESGPANAGECVLRSFRSGDAGWIVYRHGQLYAKEYGWDETFEGLVAEILGRFLKQHDPEKEQIWMAEWNGECIGSVMIVDAGEGIAQLRLLLVEPEARGKGVGRRLVEECIRFAKAKGYRRMKLWTQSNLDDARRLYVKAGFHIVEEKPHRSFGYDLVSEVWQREL